MHHLLEATSLTGRLLLWRHTLLRRFSQIGLLVLFLGTLNWSWSLAGAPLLVGNLGASEFAGVLPMADPFATLQILFTGVWPATRVLVGAAIILGLYAFLFGRAFCAWVCPLNMVTDLAAALRRRLGIRNIVNLPRNTRYTVLAASLILSMATGVAAFEWISPIGMLHREIIFGVGLGWMAVTGVFVLDLVAVKRGWCGHLCPLGAFYSLVGGRTARLAVAFDKESCTHCGECAEICPEPQVLNLRQAERSGRVGHECTNCGECVSYCPEGSLKFEFLRKPRSVSPTNDTSSRRAS